MANIMKSRHVGASLAVCAGTMAALASVSAKLAMTEETVHHICQEVLSSFSQSAVCDTLSYLLRVSCFAGIFLFNSLMWTFYTKSLQYCSSTIEATITNTGANFLVTAFLGLTLFGEQLSYFWWLGSCLILAGLILIHKGNSESEATNLKTD
ncbi:transmembrane protein 42-like [Mya arenaria]|uniref:transmembrane protein 42-like n=1 Tax=Mya arenaria TaxID=6604 RepID=UPI0022DFCD36|nr:transmembrane protein 42-like [Mya arenaria]